MTSLEQDTQQPSYHVTAQVLVPPDIPPVVFPTTSQQSSGVVLTENSSESHESHLHWGDTPKELALTIHPPTFSSEEPVRGRVGHNANGIDSQHPTENDVDTMHNGESDRRPRQLEQPALQPLSQQAGPLSTITDSQPIWPPPVNRAAQSPNTSHQAHYPTDEAGQDEGQPRTSSLPPEETHEDGVPTISWPTESGRRRTPPPEPTHPTSNTLFSNPATPEGRAPRTPSKSQYQPITSYTPSSIRKAAHSIPLPATTLIPSPKRPRPFTRTRSGQSVPETERDSFEDDAPMGPRQRIEKIFRAESREKSASAIPTQQDDRSRDADVPDQEKTTPRAPAIPESTLIDKAGSPQPHPESESTEVLFSSNEAPLARGHFMDLASTPSRSEPELGRLFSQTFTDFGTDDPEESQLNFHATQTIKSSIPATSSPAEPPIPPAPLVLDQPAKPNQGTLAPSTTYTGVPAHRRLGRTNPRVDDSQPPRTVKSAPLSRQPPLSLVKQRAPTKMPSTFEATLVDRSSPPFPYPSPAKSKEGAAATYVTGGPPSPDSQPALRGEAKTDSNESVAPIMPLTSPLSGPAPLPPSSAPVFVSSPPKTPEPEPIVAAPVEHHADDLPVPDTLIAHGAAATTQHSSAGQVKTLPQAPSPKLTTPTQYGKRRKKLSVRALEALSDADTDQSSSPAPEDPEDYTFRPTPKKIKLTVAPKPGEKGKERHNASAKLKLTVKKKEDDDGDMAMTESGISELSDSDSSSSTPEDLEDNTYRPGGSRTDVLRTVKARVSKPNSRSRASTTSTASAKLTAAKGKSKRKSSKAFTDTSHAEITLARRLSLSNPTTPAPTLSAPLRVLGYWGQSKAYFPGTVGDFIDGKFRVDFADGMSRDLPIDRLRLLELREGDRIRSSSKRFADGTMTVVEAWDGHDRGVKVRVEGTAAGYVPLAHMYVTEAVVKRAWEDRLVEPRHLGLSSGSKLIRSNGKSVSGDSLRGMVFLITLNVDGGDASRAARKMLMETIHKQGGRVEEDWPILFDRPLDGFGSRLKAGDTPFLLVHGGEKTKPKMLAALAAGVPCISSDFVKDALERTVDWRSYIVSPGFSTVLNHHTSQLVDPKWGSDSWIAKEARNLCQPFNGQKFLFVQPTDANAISKSVKALVPFCLHALGADSLDQVSSWWNVPELAVYDHVLVEDRDSEWNAVPAAWKTSGKLCNFMWLKQCIMSGGLVPPGLL